MPAPLETCWHTSCTCTHTYTQWTPPSSASVPHSLAPKGLSVSDAGDSRASALSLCVWVFNMRGRSSSTYVLILEGLPGSLFLSFPGSGGYSSPRPWLESSNSHLCHKMGCAWLCRFTLNWPLSSGEMKPWHSGSWCDLSPVVTGVIHSLPVNVQSCLCKASPPITASLDCIVPLWPSTFLSIL